MISLHFSICFVICSWKRIHLQCRRPWFNSWVGRSVGEGIGHPLQCSWACLVAQLEENLPAMQGTWVRSLGWEYPWRGERPPTPVFWPGEFHGLYSPCSCQELDTTERLFHFQKIPGFKASQFTHGKDMQIHWLGCQVLPREPQPTWPHSSPLLWHLDIFTGRLYVHGCPPLSSCL